MSLKREKKLKSSTGDDGEKKTSKKIKKQKKENLFDLLTMKESIFTLTITQSCNPSSEEEKAINCLKEYVFDTTLSESNTTLIVSAKKKSEIKNRYFALKIKKNRPSIKQEENFLKKLQPFDHTLKIVESIFIDCWKIYILVFERYFNLLMFDSGDINDIWILFHQLILIADHLKKNSIIHRDIKPENIFFDWNEKKELCFILGDFGIAIENECPWKGIAGTDNYMAPEVLTNEEYDFGADLWSIGVVIAELVTKESPFFEGNDWEVYQCIQRKLENHPLHYCDDQEMNFILNKILQIDPKKRIQVEETLEILNKHFR